VRELDISGPGVVEVFPSVVQGYAQHQDADPGDWAAGCEGTRQVEDPDADDAATMSAIAAVKPDCALPSDDPLAGLEPSREI
jgi:hypothetical protein